MSNKVSLELGMNVTGYKQGMKDAKDSTQQYNTETKKVKDNLQSFRGEIGRAKKEVQNLALAYSKLSKEAKQSQFGIEMKKQLDAAKQSAAELIDMQGDLQTELKNMASDTQMFDMMSEGFTTVASVASTALGAIAMFTGKEEDAKNAVLAFTTAQSVLTAATKIQNALQMQSNTMLAVQKVQALAATAAIRVKAAAEGKSILATKAATVAQALFNKVAYANPYVILAAAIIGVTAALATFIHMSSQAREEEEKAAKQAEIHKTYNEALNNELSNLVPALYKLQAEWKNLRTEAEKTQWIKENQTEFNNLGIQIDNVADAENVFVNNTDAVIEALMLRAKAAAQAAVAQKKYEESLERIGKLEGARGKKNLSKEDLKDLGVTNTKNIKQEDWGILSNKYSVDVDKEILEEKKKADAELKKSMESMVKTQQEGYKKLKDNGVKAAGSASKAVTKAHKSGSKENKKELAKNSVEEAEAYLKAWQEKLSKVDINDATTIKTINTNIEKWQKELDKRKLQVGMEVKEGGGSVKEAEQQLKVWQEKLSEVDVNNTAAVNTIKEMIDKLQKELDKRKLAVGMEVKQETVSDLLKKHEQILKANEEEAEAALMMAKIHGEDVAKIESLQEAYNKAKKSREDYENTKSIMTEGDTFGAARSGDFEKSINGYETAISALQSRLQTIDLTNGGSEAKALWGELTSLVSKYREELLGIEEDEEAATMTALEKKKEQAQKTAEAYATIGDAASSVGDAFSSLSKLADDNPVLNIAGIIAQAVAKVMLGFATASAESASMTPFGWLAFTIAGLATALSVVAQIKSAAEAHAMGGIVGGSSYSGDNVLTRLNSGEMVLNKKQQQNLFNAINSGNLGSNSGTQTVQVQGVIRGTDILLVSKQANKIKARTGTEIHI